MASFKIKWHPVLNFSCVVNLTINMKKVVFCDFDETISKEDSTDLILERFAADSNWLMVEKDWQNGHIGAEIV